MADPIIITPDEAKAILSLKRFARKWPQSLKLFSWSGTLIVVKRSSDDIDASIAHIPNIPNDGGDPEEFSSARAERTKEKNMFCIDTEPEILWP